MAATNYDQEEAPETEATTTMEAMKRPLPWFRLHTNILHNPKIQLLPADLFRQWVNLLACYTQNHDTMPGVRELSFHLRISPEQVTATLDALHDAELLDRVGDTYIPHDWDEHQYRKPSQTKERQNERQQRSRANRRTHDVTVTTDVTTDVTPKSQPGHTTRVQSTETEYRGQNPESTSRISQDFGRFWAAYPRKSGQRQAILAWERIDPDVTLVETIMRSLAAWKESPKWIHEPDFIPGPVKWLDDRRWEQEPPSMPVPLRSNRPTQSEINRGGTGRAVI